MSRPRPADGPATGQVGQSGLAELTARRDRLRVELAGLVEARRQAEEVAARVPGLLRAIAVVRRDGDGGSSAVLRRHRETFERVMGDLEDTQVLIARVQTRLARCGDPVEGHRLRAGEVVCRRAVLAMVAIGAALADDPRPTDATNRAQAEDRGGRAAGAGGSVPAGGVVGAASTDGEAVR